MPVRRWGDEGGRNRACTESRRREKSNAVGPRASAAGSWKIERRERTESTAAAAIGKLELWLSKQELEWAEIVAVSFPEGDAWAHLDLADGDTLPTMAFQRADGARGIAAARQMAALVAARGEATEAGA